MDQQRSGFHFPICLLLRQLVREFFDRRGSHDDGVLHVPVEEAKLPASIRRRDTDQAARQSDEPDGVISLLCPAVRFVMPCSGHDHHGIACLQPMELVRGDNEHRPLTAYDQLVVGVALRSEQRWMMCRWLAFLAGSQKGIRRARVVDSWW